MRLYRICPERYLEDYSGRGASYRDGARWNSPGHPVLYFACSAATALLELANYLPSPRLVPADYRLGVYELPDEVVQETLPRTTLPPDWAAYPYPEATRCQGDAWLKARKHLILLVPSAAVPGGLDDIAVFNPAHPQSVRIRLHRAYADLYNARTFRGIEAGEK